MLKAIGKKSSLGLRWNDLKTSRFKTRANHYLTSDIRNQFKFGRRKWLHIKREDLQDQSKLKIFEKKMCWMDKYKFQAWANQSQWRRKWQTQLKASLSVHCWFHWSWLDSTRWLNFPSKHTQSIIVNPKLASNDVQLTLIKNTKRSCTRK